MLQVMHLTFDVNFICPLFYYFFTGMFGYINEFKFLTKSTDNRRKNQTFIKAIVFLDTKA